METPAFALSIPRPHVYLLARGVLRDWLLRVDPELLVGRRVALHSAASGDRQGYRRLRHLLEGTPYHGLSSAALREACPKGHLVGLATLVRAERLRDGREAPLRGWRVHLEQAQPVRALPFAVPVELELWALPPGLRLALARSAAPARAPTLPPVK